MFDLEGDEILLRVAFLTDEHKSLKGWNMVILLERWVWLIGIISIWE